MSKRSWATALVALGGFAALGSTPALADTVTFDDDVTNDVIFGSGNANGGWTTARGEGVEVALRAKVRYDTVTDQPQNVFNSNGDGTYDHAAGHPAANSARARWSFEWSVNSDYDDSSGWMLDDLTYLLQIDYDPSQGTNYLAFDPINLAFADHAIGDNTTGSGGGTSAATVAQYASLIAANNLGQNSWQLNFFTSPGSPFDPDIDATYDFVLSAYDGSTMLAQSHIQVIVGNGGPPVVPLPAAAWAAAPLLLGLMSRLRRRRNTA